MKKLFSLFVTFVLTILVVLSMTSCTSSKSTICIVKYGTHTSLDEIQDAVEGEIKEKLDMSKYQIKDYDCNFDSSIITSTMAEIKSQKGVVAVVAIATPVAAVAKSMLPDIPVVFAAVSDPVSANIVENMDEPEGHVTGTSDAVDITKLVDLAYSVNENVKKLGYIYTSSEANSLSNLSKLESYAKEKGFILDVKAIEKAADITDAANTIISDGIDGLIVTDDNNVASAMSILSGKCSAANIPMYCAADSEVKDGGMMGYSISYTKLGILTADMVVEIASGVEIKNIPVKVFDSSELSLYYNSSFLSQASKITIPSSILEKAIDLSDK